jgi:hypothetical protein
MVRRVRVKNSNGQNVSIKYQSLLELFSLQQLYLQYLSLCFLSLLKNASLLAYLSTKILVSRFVLDSLGQKQNCLLKTTLDRLQSYKMGIFFG